MDEIVVKKYHKLLRVHFEYASTAFDGNYSLSSPHLEPIPLDLHKANSFWLKANKRGATT